MNQSPLSGVASVLALTLVLAMGGVAIARAANEPPVPVRMVPPEYPYELKRNGVTGVVTLTFEVDEKGNVVDPKVQKSTNPGFEQPALEAIVKWKFKPGKKDGVPARMKIGVPLQFNSNT
jgi:periplasmic protein TonB